MDSMENIKLLEQAHKVCKERGARLTAQREQVLQLLADKNSAVGAYDLLAEMQKTDAAAKPATIYRALDFLNQQGFVHKIESLNAFVICSHMSGCSHPTQLLICDECGHVEEMQSNKLDQALQSIAKTKNFKVSHQIIEAHGFCQNCC